MLVYLAICLIDGKIYVGKTIQSLKDRWDGHCRPGRKKTFFDTKVHAYGKENFLLFVLRKCLTVEEMDLAECAYIELLNATNPAIGYNRKVGGKWNFRGRKHSEETKQKMRLASLGNKNGFGGANTYSRIGRKASEETRKRMRLAWIRRKARENKD